MEGKPGDGQTAGRAARTSTRSKGLSASKRRPGRLASSTGVAVAVMLAAACGACQMPAAAGNASGVPAELKSSMNPAPLATVEDGGEVRWPIDGVPINMNYLHQLGNEDNVRRIYQAVSARPGRETVDGKIVPNPDYVSGWESRPLGAGMVTTIKINPKATWSNGRSISWEDFKAQALTFAKKPKRYKLGSHLDWNGVTRVEKGIDEDEAIIFYDKPYADWRASWTVLLPKELFASPKAFNKGWKNEIKITAGPFRWAGFDQATKTIKLERNLDWWGRRPKLDKITFQMIPGDKQLEALARKQVDLSDEVSGANSAQAKRIKHIDLRYAAGPNWRGLIINATAQHLNDPAVRQAIMLAVDREKLAKAALAGLKFPPLIANNLFYLPTQAGYEDTSGNLGTPDLARAKRLLDTAGWKADGTTGFRTKGGKQLELVYPVPSGIQANKEAAERTRSMMQKIGINLEIKEVDVNVFFAELQAGKFGLTELGVVGIAAPGKGIAAFKSLPDPKTKKGAGDNMARNGNAEIDKLLEQAVSATDPSVYTKKLNTASRKLIQIVHMIPLYQAPQVIAADKNLVNIGASGFAHIDWTKAGWRK